MSTDRLGFSRLTEDGAEKQRKHPVRVEENAVLVSGVRGQDGQTRWRPQTSGLVRSGKT